MIPHSQSCMGGETISDRTYFIVCICSVIFFTSGINGVLAIFLDVEGDPSENLLQPSFRVFMILTIVCSLIVRTNTHVNRCAKKRFRACGHFG